MSRKRRPRRKTDADVGYIITLRKRKKVMVSVHRDGRCTSVHLDSSALNALIDRLSALRSAGAKKSPLAGEP